MGKSKKKSYVLFEVMVRGVKVLPFREASANQESIP